MKINPQSNQLPKNVPSWAKERLQKLMAAGDKLEADSEQLPDGYVKRELSAERAYLNNLGARREFTRFRSLDNDTERGADRDPTPNKIDLGWSQFELSGNLNSGYELQTTDNNHVNLVLHEGSVTKVVNIYRSGSGLYSRLDAENPEASVSFETAASKRARTSDLVTEHFEATTKASDLIGPPKGESAVDKSANLFFHDSDSLPEVRKELMDGVRAGLDKLPQSEQKAIKALLDKPNAHTPRRLSHALLQMAKADPDNKELAGLRELAGSWQILEDAPKLMADGLVRTMEFYMAPGNMQMKAAAQGWDFDKKTGLPITDTVVVGGGPGGLATGYHLSEQGQQTVIFEGGKIGQAFSDASAQSVHQLRTNSSSSNLIYTNSGAVFEIDASLRRHSELIREKGEDAKESWNELRGEKDHSGQEGYGALNRNNLFEHMAQLGHGLATKYPDTFLIENSPITSITKEKRGDETLFRVKSEKGHELMTRSLVMATGFVGSNGEYARGLQQFQEFETQSPENVTVLGSDHDIIGKNEQLLDHNQALVFSDRLLGRPEIRERIKSLPVGANLAVIGSGESAAKGTIEALNLNPELTVDLYTKNPLEPYQVQIPVSHFSRTVTEHAIKNEELANQTLREFKELKTPITTQTMKDLLSFEAEGRLRIRELGKRFNKETVDVKLKSDDSNSFELTLKDGEVSRNLAAQRESWVSSGLYGNRPPSQSPDHLPDADMVMMAVGYDSSKVNANPLMQQLIDQDLVEIRDGKVQYGADGLTSSKSPQVGFNTASAVRMSADTALPGRAIRGLRLAQNLAQKLPEREPPSEEDSITQVVDQRRIEEVGDGEREIPDLEFAQSLLSFKRNGFEPRTVEISKNVVEDQADPHDRAWAERHHELEIKFAGPNETVRALVGRFLEYPDSLTAAEKLTAQRALQIAERLERSDGGSG